MSKYYIALRSPLHGQTSWSGAHSPVESGGYQLALGWAGLITLLVGGSWLLPGFLFGTDWPGPRYFQPPTASESLAPIEAAAAAMAWAIGGEATGKLLILGTIWVAGTLAYRALPVGGFVPRAAAATLYAINPFVYGRLHYGQIFVLAAYALLPWALTRLRDLLTNPGPRAALGVAAAFLLIGIFSPHMFLIVALLAILLYATHVLARQHKLEYLRWTGPWIVAAIAVTAVASSYWVLPLLLGRGYGGGILGSGGSGQLIAYAAVPDSSIGLLPNLAGLYGFWAENTGRFSSMKEFVPFWPVGLAGILVIATIGVASIFKGNSRELAPYVGGLVAAMAIALVLETGLSDPATSGLVRWLDSHFAVYRGMRDAGKWGALLALGYSQLMGLGAAAILVWPNKAVRTTIAVEWTTALAAAVLLALPLYYGNGLLFGAHGAIKPSQYPQGWYAADRLLASDHHPGRTVVLPWHQYMSYDFIQNQNKVVGSPGPTFFSVPVLVSGNPEVAGIAAPTDPDQVAISTLVTDGEKGHWAQVLAAHGVKYLLLSHELEWKSYAYLDFQPGLVKIADFGSIDVYRDSLSP